MIAARKSKKEGKRICVQDAAEMPLYPTVTAADAPVPETAIRCRTVPVQAPDAGAAEAHSPGRETGF